MMTNTTYDRRSHEQAMEDAEQFRAMFPESTYQRWEFGGSLRRRRETVGDIEHVVIPQVGEVEVGDGLFKQKQVVNLLWHHLDAMVKGGLVRKAIYGVQGFRWGDRMRGTIWRGFRHEIFTADRLNWGAILAIRTGPAEFSRRMIESLVRQGYGHREGFVVNKRDWRCQECGWAGIAPNWRAGEWDSQPLCPGCDGEAVAMERVVTPTEHDFFLACGMRYLRPGERR